MAKFLVLASLGPNQPDSGGAAQAADAVKGWVTEQQRGGRVEVAYTYPGGGGAAIINAESTEDLQQVLVSNPATAFLRYEVRPLVEFHESMDRVAEGRSGGDTW
jgi:muconolactone delta-isomerase